MKQIEYKNHSAGAGGFEQVAIIRFDKKPCASIKSSAMATCLETLQEKKCLEYVVMPTDCREIYLLGRS